MELYIVRHTSVDVQPGTCYGRTDVPLRRSFHREAVSVRMQLRKITFDAVYTSPLTRATKLATFCGFPSAIQDSRLCEMYMGEWEMQRFENISDPYLDEWYNDYLHKPTAGGESFIDLCARVRSFFEEINRANFQRVLVFAHGGIIVSAKFLTGNADKKNPFNSLPPYGGIARIEL